jgi:hypothetical protein
MREKDPRTTEPLALKDITVVRTVVGGTVIHES